MYKENFVIAILFAKKDVCQKNLFVKLVEKSCLLL